MIFNKEADFEKTLITTLFDKGWEAEVLKNPTEEDLIKNWANILFENNRSKDQLNNIPLTNSEMQQILEQIKKLETPLKLNKFINGKTIMITRDNPADTLHYGKEISLKIYDRQEIAAGQSRYQIVQQPKFVTSSQIMRDRRGDLMLLINGMPVIHIELKRSGVPVSQAANQIEKYSRQGAFSGLFSLVQIFVAMNPEETVYFANTGQDVKFNPDYYFHWADLDNEPINNWKNIASELLSIPMAHRLIGFYTVADSKDGILKVMRSYQYYAANAISVKVSKMSKTDWSAKNSLGGYIWHTTGSGKTMTSFKSAQLIAASQDADKVVFLMDRIELGTQSLEEYRGFANDGESVQETEDTGVLISKLKSSDPADTLIVTSIQKMNNIKSEEYGLNSEDLNLINSKNIVFIIDEAHRSTFGDMLITIKDTFSRAIFFGFTGTPIQAENQKKMNDTSTIFGDELHRYSIADGLRDKNVLGFDPYRIATYKDSDVRKTVALHKAKAKDENEAINDEAKSIVYDKFMDTQKVKMAGCVAQDGKYIKGIEDYLSNSQYERIEHQEQVVSDISNSWVTLSKAGKFHAIFAVSSIPEAIAYYRLIKEKIPHMKVTALFDSSDNIDNLEYKEEGLIEIIQDYNQRYEKFFTLSTHANFKKDIASRLAHKIQYQTIDRIPEKQLDLLIVVHQMLTGFDSKWVNTLYLDKVLKYENIIQAFSRTNRLFGPEKPFGTIRYYRKVHTMEKNIRAAISLYSGDKPFGICVDKLEKNLLEINSIFEKISDLFMSSGVSDFEKLPSEESDCRKFALLFKELNSYLEAAKIQGFKWGKPRYDFSHGKGHKKTIVEMKLDEKIYLILALRYKELSGNSSGKGSMTSDAPFDIVGYLTEIDTGVIDADYMNSKFQKYFKLIKQQSSSQASIDTALNELHKTFATLTQEEQKYADIFIHDIQGGNIIIEDGKSCRDYITEYQAKEKNKKIQNLVESFGLDENKLRHLISLDINEANINECGRFDDLKKSVDLNKAKAYFDNLEGLNIPLFKISMKIDMLLREILTNKHFEIK